MAERTERFREAFKKFWVIPEKPPKEKIVPVTYWPHMLESVAGRQFKHLKVYATEREVVERVQVGVKSFRRVTYWQLGIAINAEAPNGEVFVYSEDHEKVRDDDPDGMVAVRRVFTTADSRLSNIRYRMGLENAANVQSYVYDFDGDPIPEAELLALRDEHLIPYYPRVPAFEG